MAMLLGCARAKENGVDTTTLAKHQFHHLVVDRIEGCHVKQTTPDAGLVGCHHDAKAVLVQTRNGLNGTVDRLPFLGRFDEVIAVVINHAIAVKNHQLGLRSHEADST